MEDIRGWRVVNLLKLGKVIISIPAKNEEKTIGKVIDEIKCVMDKNYRNYEIIVLNDGSKDMTAKVAKEHGAIVYSHQINKGLAKTFNSEIKYCLERNADIIIHIDADGQYSANDFIILLEKLNQGYDLVLGSRFLGTIEYMPWLKRIGNKIFSRVISKLTGICITDSQTGLRAMKRKVAENIKITSNFSYTQEQIIKAVKGNFFVKEVPVTFRKRDGKSRLMKSPFHYAAKASVNLLRVYRDYEPLKFFCSLGLLFFFFGLMLGLYLIYLHLTTGITGHIPLVMLTALAIIMGLQIILFGFLADMLKKV